MSNSNDHNQLENQLVVARNEIRNLRNQLNSLKQLHRKECDQIYETLTHFKCGNCDQNKPAPPESPKNIVNLQYIGIIETDFPQKRATPRQTVICGEIEAKLTLFNDVLTNPNHALQGLEEFSHMWIIFHFHENHSTHTPAKVCPPRLNGLKLGVFATRSPNRPSPIGLSLVKISRIEGNDVHFKGVDMIDGTPVIDIKPYIPKYDSPITDSMLPVATVSDHGYSSATRNSECEDDHFLEQSDENLEMAGAAGISKHSLTLNGSHQLDNSRSASRIGEREAPDGEEEDEEATNQPNVASGLQNSLNVRVPSWIDKPEVSSLKVLFKEKALAQLQRMGSDGDGKKTIIMNVLQEDPRSIYLRERWSSHCYVFRIANLNVSCKFNDNDHSVKVYQIFEGASE